MVLLNNKNTYLHKLPRLTSWLRWCSVPLQFCHTQEILSTSILTLNLHGVSDDNNRRNRKKKICKLTMHHQLTATCCGVHVSRLTLLTLDIWTPRLRWMPAQRMHRKIPKFHDAHLGPVEKNVFVIHNDRHLFWYLHCNHLLKSHKQKRDISCKWSARCCIQVIPNRSKVSPYFLPFCSAIKNFNISLIFHNTGEKKIMW